MSQVYNAEEEIDKLVDKYSDELKIRMKKVLAKHTRLVMKECMVPTSNSNRKAATSSSNRKYDDRYESKRRDYRRHDSDDDSD